MGIRLIVFDSVKKKCFIIRWDAAYMRSAGEQANIQS